MPSNSSSPGSASTSYTFSNRSSGSNSNQGNNARQARSALREQFRLEGRPESWWNPMWWRQEQERRRAARVANLLVYPSFEIPAVSILKSLASRELSGKLNKQIRFRPGNLAVRVRDASGRKRFYTLTEFKTKYGNKWQYIPSGSRRPIKENSNIQRKQVRVVRFT